MKKLGIETSISNTQHGRFGAMQYEKLREHGFLYADLGLCATDTDVYTLPIDEARARIDEKLSLAKAAGVTIWQVHGPWRYPPRDLTDEDRAERFAKMSRSIALCAMLGAKYWVIHPIMPYGVEDLDNGHAEDTYRMNIDFMRRLLAVAKANGVTICYENMPFLRFSLSTPEQIMRVVNEINDESFRVCLDTGHVNVFEGLAIGDAVRTVGKKLAVVHIHDNHGDGDRHQWPGDGTIDWSLFKTALDEIGFDGVYSLETLPKGEMTDEEYDAQSVRLGKIARALFAEG